MTFLGNLNVFVLYQGLSAFIKCSFIVDYWRRQVMVMGYLNCSYFVLCNLYTWYLYQSQKKLPVPTSKTKKKKEPLRGLYIWYAVISQGINRSEPWNPTPTTGDTCDARFDFFLLQIIKSNHILSFLFPINCLFWSQMYLF